ncbi:hypothetical protein [Tenacibaculum sp. SG-28]|uniref:hypothetical protein n=1 Tax=Tenacibaculum sp. SG-28 TaxID=754426 RepID=UPI001304918C|nr:hypothetical protein [Tenacibaculum sp. SG-28]
MTEIDSVKENLNGYWVMDLGRRNTSTETILCLKFNEYSAFWEHVIIKNGMLNKTFEFNTSGPVASLIKVNDSVKIELVNLGGADTTKIEYLTKTKFRINDITYFKHKGYPELKTIME